MAQWLNSEKVRLSFLVLLSAAMRSFFLFRYDNVPGDAAGHVERAFQILRNPSLWLNFEGSSSVLYKYALASFVYFWRDPLYAPKVFTLIFGIFLVLPYYGTIKVLFDRRIAFFSSLVLVFYPLHVIQSGVTTSDAVYYFFLFSSFYYYFKFQSGREPLFILWLGAALFNIAALLRFECWMFIPVLSLLLWHKSQRAAVTFLFLASIMPCADMVMNQICCGDFLYTFHISAKSIQLSIATGKVPYDPRLLSWFFLLLKNSGPSLVVGGLGGIAVAIFMRQRAPLAIFFAMLFFMLSASSYVARMWHHDRYSISLGLFLIPYAWFLIDRAWADCGRWKKIFFVFFLILPVIDFWPMLEKPTNAFPLMMPLTPKEVQDLSAWLRNNIRPGEMIVIDPDPYSFYSGNILIHSRILSSRCLLIVCPYIGRATFPHKNDFLNYIWSHRTKYLFLNSKGYLQKLLSFDLEQKKVYCGGVAFEVVFERDVGIYGKYIIYRLSYQKQGNDHGAMVQ